MFYNRIKQFQGVNYPRVVINSNTPDMTMFAAMPMILYAVDKEKNVSRDMLSQAADIMKKTFPVEVDRRTDLALWESVNDSFTNAYKLFSLMKIV